MDEALFGSRDRRGDWTPAKPLDYPRVFVGPPQLRAILRWLPGYLLPWNLLYALLAVLFWVYLTPSLATMQTLEPGWIGLVLLRNAAATLLFFGAWHLWLYVRRAQGISFKLNAKWQATDSGAFLFRDQTIDNMIWTFASGVPIWTAWEVLTLWAMANGWIGVLDFAAHPVWGTILLLLIPLFREVHFYLVHRAIHWPPLYRTVHRLHHLNANPGPWSGLSMHPLEHLPYFSGVILHWVLPSHPVHAIFHLLHAGLSPAPGHTGFDKLVTGKERLLDIPCFAHYLHHKYFECNYADGSIPLDRWLGTFHDGSKEAHEAMRRRIAARRRSDDGARSAAAALGEP